MKTVLSLALFSLLFFSSAHAQKKQVLIMEINYITGFSGIYLHWADKEMEFIDTEKATTRAKIKEQGKILRDVFQRLYNEGWEIENSSWGAVGEAEVIRYILVKE